MMTSRNVPLRGIADSTKRESAPPADPLQELRVPLQPRWTVEPPRDGICWTIRHMSPATETLCTVLGVVLNIPRGGGGYSCRSLLAG